MRKPWADALGDAIWQVVEADVQAEVATVIGSGRIEELSDRHADADGKAEQLVDRYAPGVSFDLADSGPLPLMTKLGHAICWVQHERRAEAPSLDFARWAEEALRQSAKAPAVKVGTTGGYQMVMRGSTMFLLQPPVPGMPAELARALERRNRATVEGVCECGGRRHLGAVRPGHVALHHVVHEEGCIAHDRALAEIATGVVTPAWVLAAGGVTANGDIVHGHIDPMVVEFLHRHYHRVEMRTVEDHRVVAVGGIDDAGVFLSVDREPDLVAGLALLVIVNLVGADAEALLS